MEGSAWTQEPAVEKRRFECDECGRVLIGPAGLRVHHLLHHADLRLASCRSVYEAHKLRRQMYRGLCDECGYESHDSRAALNQHISRAHLLTQEMKTSHKYGNEKSCDECGLVSLWPNHLFDHFAKKHADLSKSSWRRFAAPSDIKKARCDEEPCKELRFTKTMLLNHIAQAHIKDTAAARIFKVIRKPKHPRQLGNGICRFCDDCGVVGRGTSELFRHVIVRHANLKSVNWMAEFRLVEHAETPCSINFAAPQNLSCDDCGHEMNSNQALIYHIRSHLALFFPYNSAWKHKRSKERPKLICDLCGRAKSFSVGLRRHFAEAHPFNRTNNAPAPKKGQAIIHCDSCNSRFKFRDGLLRHTYLVHDGPTYEARARPYKRRFFCDRWAECGFAGAVNRPHLIRHLSSSAHHSG